MKTYFNLFLLFLIVFTACGNRKATANQQGDDVQTDSIKTFTLPTIPAMLNTPELRADYLIRHYWENMNFADTTYLNQPDVMEQAWVDYIDIMPLVPDTIAVSAIRQLFRDTEKEKKVFLYFTGMAEKYLYEPNSPMRNEELYIPVLDAMLGSAMLNDTEKIRPEKRRKLAEQNRPGRQAEDFTYTLASGKSGTLYGVKANYTLLFINNPGCHACEETINELKYAPAINREFAAGKLKILSVYPDEEVEEWRKYLSDFPREWINAYDKRLMIKGKNLYDLKAIPTLYLLDKDKKVLLKDATTMQIDQYLQ